MAFSNNDIDMIFRKQDVAEYGNNLVYLNTFTRNDDGTTIRHNIAGILEDMPTFSNTVNWQDTAMRDKVGKFINNSLNSKVYKGFEMAAMYFGNYLNPQMVEMGEYTQQVYNGTTNNALQLKFVVPYDGVIGSQKFSNPDEIISIILSQNTPRKQYNLGEVLSNTVASFVAIFNDVDAETKKNEEMLEIKTRMPPETLIAMRDIIKMKIVQNVKSVIAQAINQENGAYKVGVNGQNIKPFLNIDESPNEKNLLIVSFSSEENNQGASSEFMRIVLKTDDELRNMYSSNGEALKSLYDVMGKASDMPLSKFVEFKCNGLSRLNSKEVTRVFKMSEIICNTDLFIIDKKHENNKQLYNWLRNKIYNETIGTSSQFSQVPSNIFGRLEASANNMFTNMFPGDATRAVSVTNASNIALGVKLWNLQIYSGLFKRHFVGFITGVDVKPSKELIGDKPAYTEFNFTFEFDRTMSAEVYLSKLVNYNESRIQKIKTSDLNDTENQIKYNSLF